MKLRQLIVFEDGDAAGTVSADIATVAYPLFVKGRNRKEKRANARRAVGQKPDNLSGMIGRGVFEQYSNEMLVAFVERLDESELRTQLVAEIDRRGFLKGLGAAATLAAVPSLAKAGQQLKKQPNFQQINKEIKEIFAKNIRLPANFQQPTTAGKFGFKFDLNGKLLGKKVLDSCGSPELDKAVMDSATNIPVSLVKQWYPEENGLDSVTIGFGVGDKWYMMGSQQASQQPVNSGQSLVLIGNIKVGDKLDQIKNANPKLQEDDQWSAAGIAGQLADYFGVINPAGRIKLVGNVKLLGSKDKLHLLFNKNNQCNGMAIVCDYNGLPEEWKEAHGLMGFNKGEFLTFLKHVVANFPQSMGTKVGKLKTREDGGLGLNGGIGYGKAIGNNTGIAVGVGFAKTGWAMVSQQLEKNGIKGLMGVIGMTNSHGLTGVHLMRPNVVFVFDAEKNSLPELEFESVEEAHVLGNDSVIYRLDRENPMSDTEVVVIGGAGRYSLEALRNKARREADQLAQDLKVEHGGAFRNGAHNVKQLANTLNTIVAAYNELKRIRSKGGRGSRGITDEDANFIRECMDMLHHASKKLKG